MTSETPIGVGGVSGISAARAVEDGAGKEAPPLSPASLVNGPRCARDFDQRGLRGREFEVETKTRPVTADRWEISATEYGGDGREMSEAAKADDAESDPLRGERNGALIVASGRAPESRRLPR